MMLNLIERWWFCAIAEKRLGLTLLICVHIAICCISIVCVSRFEYQTIDPATSYRVLYDPIRLGGATVVVTAFAFVSLLFVFTPFSFGYFVGFYLYTMILGYLWINCFSILNYDHQLTGLSAAGSAVAFLVPVLLISSPIRQTYVLSLSALDRLLMCILLLAVTTIAAGAMYNFRLIGLGEIYVFRDKIIESPAILNYLIRINSSVLLPFAFACFMARKHFLRAGCALFLIWAFFPLTLTKLAVFTPVWLVFMAILTRVFRSRTAVILSIFFPMFAGVLAVLFERQPLYLFHLINFRMITIPSIAMDIYNHYFANHDHTYFCQVRLLKAIMPCPYQDQLSVVMEKAYHLGDFNASLFATEGIASVGLQFAPVTAFLCGLVIALGNRTAAGLSSGFVLISAAIVPQILLNVPLTTTLLTHGLGILFLLWYITPRTMFEANPIERTAQAS
jgi:hypothetical protein